jgi:uncharacterized protein YcsI (UPF0317 family)
MLQLKTPHDIRKIIRTAEYTGYTAGLAPEYVQGNLVILPQADALDFAIFCHRNPKPCPIIGISTPGDPFVQGLLGELDVRTDLSQYRVFKNGNVIAEPNDIIQYWRDDLVAFVIGCSFSFEKILLDAGFKLPHIEKKTMVPMYQTSVMLSPTDKFLGNMVVSMRSFPKDQVADVVKITSKYPQVHGTPVHIGNPKDIGIFNLYEPMFGDAPDKLPPDHVPLFWGCGVTPQLVVNVSKPKFCITHYPGCMLVTDLLINDLI